MWNTETPLRVSSHAQLGDPLFLMADESQAAKLPTPDWTETIAQVYQRIFLLEQQVRSLEAQTPHAYWTRFCRWFWSQWSWR